MADLARVHGFSALQDSSSLPEDGVFLKGLSALASAGALPTGFISIKGFASYQDAASLDASRALVTGFGGYAGDVPIDDLSPGTPVIGEVTGQQSTSQSALGKTAVTINWTEVATQARISGEHVGTATGGADTFTTVFYPAATDEKVLEVTGYDGGGADTTFSTDAAQQSTVIEPTSMTGLSVGGYLELSEGSTKEYVKVETLGASDITLTTRIRYPYTASATIKSVSVLTKTETTDYTWNGTTGDLTLVAGQFTNGSEVAIEYAALIDDLEGYELWRLDGNPYPDKTVYDIVTAHGTAVLIDDAISPSATSYQDTLDVSYNGKTVTYHLFAFDDGTPPNRSLSQSVLIESIPTLIQGLSKLVGDSKVTLTWDALTDPNVNGVNIYRCQGSWDPANAVQVNSSVLTGTSFLDGAENTTTRRPVGEVAAPANGQTYYYVAEAVDSVTDWDTGTQNQASDPLRSEVTTATKTDS